ncbi:MAG: peptidoglycan editing factor PgeF [Anaerolineae bacterium]|nr:peptidoglycan editing factor PgeF [Anaerolineae bacterium]
MNRVERDSLVFYQFEGWQQLPVKHGVFTRIGGVSDSPFAALNMGGNVGDTSENVRINHERMYAACDVRGERACSVWQIHSAEVVLAKRPARNRRWLGAADALITNQLDMPLTMRFADCTPILLIDPVEGVIAIVHAGWRGTVQGVAAATVRGMVQTLGSKPSNILAGIGPSIGPARYQVGEEVVQAVFRYFRTIEGLVHRDPSDGSAYLDLWTANRLDLERAGVGTVETAGICTAEHVDEFYSHRAENGRTGRFGAVISL